MPMPHYLTHYLFRFRSPYSPNGWIFPRTSNMWAVRRKNKEIPLSVTGSPDIASLYSRSSKKIGSLRKSFTSSFPSLLLSWELRKLLGEEGKRNSLSPKTILFHEQKRLFSPNVTISFVSWEESGLRDDNLPPKN